MNVAGERNMQIKIKWKHSGTSREKPGVEMTWKGEVVPAKGDVEFDQTFRIPVRSFGDVHPL